MNKAYYIWGLFDNSDATYLNKLKDEIQAKLLSPRFDLHITLAGPYLNLDSDSSEKLKNFSASDLAVKNKFSNFKKKDSNNFFLLAGPCAIEGEDMAFEIADHIQKVCHNLEIPFIFKGSYRKANRSRLDSFTGIGDEKALTILQKHYTNYKYYVI